MYNKMLEDDVSASTLYHHPAPQWAPAQVSKTLSKPGKPIFKSQSFFPLDLR